MFKGLLLVFVVLWFARSLIYIYAFEVVCYRVYSFALVAFWG